jgi:hypothetical protein
MEFMRVVDQSEQQLGHARGTDEAEALRMAHEQGSTGARAFRPEHPRAMVDAIRDTAYGAVSAQELLCAALRGAPSVGRTPRVSEAIAVYLA